MFEILEGKKIRLRKARESDSLSMLKNVWGDEDVYRWMLYAPTFTAEEALERCRRSMAYQKDHYAYFIALKDPDTAVGLCAIRENEPGHFEESGICIGREHQGKGLGRETLALLLDLAFIKLDAADFRYGYFSDNERSRRLAESFGFQYTGSHVLTHPWDGREIKIDSCILTRENYLKRRQDIDAAP